MSGISICLKSKQLKPAPFCPKKLEKVTVGARSIYILGQKRKKIQITFTST